MERRWYVVPVAGHRFFGSRRLVANHLRSASVGNRGIDRYRRRRRDRHGDGRRSGLFRRLGRRCHHEGGGRVAGDPHPSFGHLVEHDTRRQHVEHRSDTRSGLLDALCTHTSRRGTHIAGTGLRQTRTGSWREPDSHHRSSHHSQRFQHLDGARQLDCWRGDRRRGFAELPRGWRTRAEAGVGIDAQ